MRPLNRRKPNQQGDRPDFGGRYFSRILVATFVFSAAINILQLGMPLYSLQVFSRAIPSNNLDTLIMLTVIVVIALSLSSLLETVRTRMLTRAGNALEVSWRRRLTGDALDAAARGRPDAQPMADLMEVKMALSRPTFAALMDLPWTPVYVVGIYLIHPLLAGVMLVGMVFLAGMGVIGHLAVKGLGEESRQPSTRANRLLEAVQGKADTVRGLRMGTACLDTVNRDAMTASALAGLSAERAANIQSATKWGRMLLQILVTAVSGWLVMEQHLSFGGMIATSMLVGRGMAAFEQLVGAWGQNIKSVQAWNRLNPLLKKLSREPVKGGVKIEPARLTVENALFVSPRDQKPILRAINLSMEPGEAVCIVGANRSGKTVLARLLAGVQPPTAGTVRFGGLAVAALMPENPETGIVYVPQQPDLLPGTIGENIARFLPAEPEDIARAAERVGIRDCIETLPQGYDTDVNDPSCPLGASLSRMVSLARAAFGKPVMMVLDDPGIGLDEQSVGAVRRFIKEAKEQGTTVVVMTGQPVFLDLVDRTYVLKNGMLMDVPARQDAGQAGGQRGHMRPVQGGLQAAAS